MSIYLYFHSLMQNHYIRGENINFTPIHRAESKWWVFHPWLEYPTVGFLSVVSSSWYNVTSVGSLCWTRPSTCTFTLGVVKGQMAAGLKWPISKFDDEHDNQ